MSLKFVIIAFCVQFYCVNAQIFFSGDDNSSGIGDDCDPRSSDGRLGKCKLAGSCPEVMRNIRRRIFNHTVCGYEGMQQIVCCPTAKTLIDVEVMPSMEMLPGAEIKDRIDEEPECLVPGTKDRGEIKFPHHCHVSVIPPNPPLCDYEICKDLICCPLNKNLTSPKKCLEFGNIDEEIKTRLELNLPCTITKNELMGRYQKSCPTLEMFRSQGFNTGTVCNKTVCDNWTCCPRIPANNVRQNCGDIYEKKTVEFVGPKCVDSLTNRSGTCRPFVSCPKKEFRLFDSCYEVAGASFVCCPDVDFSQRSPTELKCLQYQNPAFTHLKYIPDPSGELEPETPCQNVAAAAGGIEAKSLEFPYMAALGFRASNSDKLKWNCGGSLISDLFILTAAHCLSQTFNGHVEVVRLGVLHLGESEVDECPEDYGIRERIPHPEYDPRFIYNDIGLIKLDRMVRFNPYVRPICLPSDGDLPETATAMGWGAIGPLAPKSEVLIKVTQEIYSHDECNRTYWNNLNRKFTRGIDLETHVCAGSRNTIESTCPGDSGGALLREHYELDKMYEIIGITSFGKPCGFIDDPGVYTKVFPFVKWITKIVWNFE